MKKALISIGIILVLAFQVGCTGSTASKDNKSTESTLETQLTSTESQTAEETSIYENPFKAGIWLSSVDGIPNGFYFFNEDGKSGSNIDFEMGMGLPFTYKVDLYVEFYMGSEELTDIASATKNDDGSIDLMFKQLDDIKLTYYSDRIFIADSTYFTNDELSEMALNFYEMKNAYRPTSTGVMVNEDGTVTIQLYDNLDDHNSTSAWYTVDRFTGKGTDDISGEAIDLNKAPKG